ncbi:unnamed protein product, partial [Menidia menidia]
TWKYDRIVVFDVEFREILDISAGEPGALHQHVSLLLRRLPFQVHQNSGGFVDLSAVVNSAARQHHGHPLRHLCGVESFVEAAHSPGRQQAPAAVQQGEHGGLSAGKTTPPPPSSSTFLK